MSDLIGNIARLKDPTGCCADNPRLLEELQHKISVTMTKLFQKPGNGGNPFIFTLSGPKPHYLAEKIGGEKLETAATDGKAYFWNPNFLADLEITEVGTVMFHEANHVLFFHCEKTRVAGRNKRRWNISADYAVNAVIERHHEKASEEARSLGKSLPALWGIKALHTPIKLKQLLDWIDGKIDELPEKAGYSDIGVIDRSPESIYDEIKLHEQNSPRKCKTCSALSLHPKTKLSKYGPGPYGPNCCPDCGQPLDGDGSGEGGCYPGESPDSHIDPSVTKDQVMGEMMKAAEAAAAIGRGYTPAEVEAALAELKKPTLSAQDIIINAFQRKAIDVGNNNDWTRFERRPQFIYEKNDKGEYVPKHKVYRPKKYDYSPKWVAMVDTSGSMGDQDIANGVKELQAVAALTDSEGWIIPCDAKPYWDAKVAINNSTDITRTKIVGRGGTVFDEFFRDLPKEIGTDMDVIVIITDGDCGAESMPISLRPKADCLWIIVSDRKDFKPAFGRVAFIEPARG